MTIDEEIGARVHQQMWIRRLAQRQIAPALGIDQSALSRKIRGRSAWTAADVIRVAAALGVEPAELLPRGGDTPPLLPSEPNNDTYRSLVRRIAGSSVGAKDRGAAAARAA